MLQYTTSMSKVTKVNSFKRQALTPNNKTRVVKADSF